MKLLLNQFQMLMKGVMVTGQDNGCHMPSQRPLRCSARLQSGAGKRCSNMGSGACSCLVAVGVYSVIILLAFVIVTILYVTAGSDCTGVRADHAQNIKKQVH